MSCEYRLTRLILIQGLGLVYLNAFAILLFQGPTLWGQAGLAPIAEFAQTAQAQLGPGAWTAFWKWPSLFYFLPVERALHFLPAIGILIAIAMTLGFANLPMLLTVWLIQLSFVNMGQVLYGYGWETQLCEFTFLCFFLVPPLDPDLRKSPFPAAAVVIWAQRWMLFRLMLGAGLIKIRGDECWRDLTCLVYHYETQPNPHPLSYFFHLMPAWFHKVGVLFNHFVELAVPFGLFGPKSLRRAAGLLTIAFQGTLILSGNLAWLNWLTLLMCIPCFDDEFFRRIWAWFHRTPSVVDFEPAPIKKWERVRQGIFAILILWLSAGPALNLVSDRQMMNTSYNQWHLVNSYGAFGSIGKERYAVIIQGTTDRQLGPDSQWSEYVFKCAPGPTDRRPCLITPYHYHLDWQIWFSSMRPELQEEWLFRLVVRLLENQTNVKNLFASTPFDDQPPRFIKMDLYRYRFADFEDWPEHWWSREKIKEYMPPISLDTPLVKSFISKAK
ncbi:MAG: lipase maturation factor family protein [Bdellovibrionales bacterium]